jgi:hypothetical protein
MSKLNYLKRKMIGKTQRKMRMLRKNNKNLNGKTRAKCFGIWLKGQEDKKFRMKLYRLIREYPAQLVVENSLRKLQLSILSFVPIKLKGLRTETFSYIQLT